MNTTDKDRLYKLLPYIHQRLDAEQGEPLRELLQVLEEQLDVLEGNIGQLYENWFIETCEDWVVPYIGELVGYTPVHEAGEVTTAQGNLRNKTLIPRREVANTIRYRRQKGSLALLELLANDVAGWPSRAVEFYKLLGWTQAVNHLRPLQGRTLDLRQSKALDRLNGPFDESAHMVDVRRINSRLSQGLYNIPSVGLFVWRLKTYSVTQTPVISLAQRHYYTFSVLGNDTPLYTHWRSETDPAQIAGELNLPVPIGRLSFTDNSAKQQASTAYYGKHKSLAIWAPDWPAKGAAQPIPLSNIVPADLSHWERYHPHHNTVAVDPVLGRILFPAKQPPKKGVKVSYYYGFSADMGGGEYKRVLSQPLDHVLYRVGQKQSLKSIKQALERWHIDQQTPANADEAERLQNAVIEITDSGVYDEQLNIELKEKQSLQIRAGNLTRPVIRLNDRPEQFCVNGKAGSYLTLDGLLIAGRGLQVEGSISGVIIRHTTLVPGWSLNSDCEPDQLEEPSIDITNANPCLTIEHSIVGSIQVNIDEVGLDPMPIRISDSIVDATGCDCEDSASEAIYASGSGIAHAVLTMARCTVFGSIDTHAIDLAENSIFMGAIRVARRQLGCMRFCYVRPGSRTPKRYNCQPDLAIQLAGNKSLQAAKAEGQPPPCTASIDQDQCHAEERVQPRFNSSRYGTPTYCRLTEDCAQEIKRGADDESEMGVFHDLFESQREANLRVRLEEYIPARADVGIIQAN